MDSCAVQLTMETKTLLILALSTFVSCDKVCENEENGDLIVMKTNVVKFSSVDSPKDSLLGNLEQSLEVDDHDYTFQIAVPYANNGSKIYLYPKKSFKDGDMIDVNMTILSDLIGTYGFKDLDFARTLGYQARTRNVPSYSNVSCYYYECDDSVLNESCSPTLRLREHQTETDIYENCKYKIAMYTTPDSFYGENDKIKARFYGQCQMRLNKVTGNIFSTWLQSAWTSNLPTIEVLKNSVTFDWGTAASKFPQGKTNKSFYFCVKLYEELNK